MKNAVMVALIATLALASTAATLVGSANAQTYNWSGLYIGAHVGGAWSSFDYRRVFPGFVGFDYDVNHDKSGWVGGGHLGLQHQFGRWVLGAEASLSGGDLDDGPFRGVSATLTDFTDVSQILLATAKLGYVIDDRWMVYAKGGFASADVKTFNIQFSNGNTVAPSRERENGWTIGAGIDYRLLNGVLVGVNYDFVSISLDDRPGGFTNPATGPSNVTAASDLDIHMVTARLTFLFGREREAVPLK